MKDEGYNQEHYNKLKEGVEFWNDWRKKNPTIQPLLRGADLEGTDLQGANLTEANLERAFLYGANLRKVFLLKACLKEATLSETDLREANLVEANLVEAQLHDADLRTANLWRANLQKADFQRTNLQGANLRGADLHDADLWEADLQKANVSFVRYKTLGHCRGIQLNGCFGSPRFIRDAKDNEFIEEFKGNHKILYWLWYLSSDCGRSLFRWIFWSLFLALYFGFNFFMLGLEHFRIDGKLPFGIVSMLYYSIVTFTTLGFGDITPQTHPGAIWVAAEVIAGYVMLGGLISIMATKLARRAS